METTIEYKDSIMRSVQVVPLARPLSPEAIGFRGLGLSPEAFGYNYLEGPGGLSKWVQSPHSPYGNPSHPSGSVVIPGYT